MIYRQLGTSDLQISAVTLGAWAIGGMFWGGTDEKDAIAAIHAALDAGITTIDTAPIYGCGRSESIVGKAIRGRREQVTILTKFGLRWDTDEGSAFFETLDVDEQKVKVTKLATRASIVHECEASLKRLGVETIDLLQHHWPDPVAPPDEIFGALEQLQRDGKIRWAGVCNYSVEQLEAARAVFPVASLQPPYSLIRRDVEDAQLPYCREHGLGVVVYSPLQLGLLTGKVSADREFPQTDVRQKNPYFRPQNRVQVNAMLERLRPLAEQRGLTLAQLIVAWTIAQPGVTAALVGARNPQQAKENAAAADVELSAHDLEEIRREALELELDLA